jgi:hypothetical protein
MGNGGWVTGIECIEEQGITLHLSPTRLQSDCWFKPRLTTGAKLLSADFSVRIISGMCESVHFTLVGAVSGVWFCDASFACL